MTGKSTNVEIPRQHLLQKSAHFPGKKSMASLDGETGNPPSKVQRFLGNPHYQAIVELKSNITNDTPYEAPRPTAQSSSDSFMPVGGKTPTPKMAKNLQYISEFSVVERQGFKFHLNHHFFNCKKHGARVLVVNLEVDFGRLFLEWQVSPN